MFIFVIYYKLGNLGTQSQTLINYIQIEENKRAQINVLENQQVPNLTLQTCS